MQRRAKVQKQPDNAAPQNHCMSSFYLMTPRELLLPESESRSVIQIRNCHKGTPPTAKNGGRFCRKSCVHSEGEGGRTRLGNAVGGTRAREHRASEEIQHEMRLMHRTYWSHRRLLTWSRHAGRWRPL